MDVRDYYERYWTDEGWKPIGKAGPAMQRFLTRSIRPGRWLDVGCGDGRTAGLWLREHGCEYVGVDISGNAVEQACELGLDARRIDDAAALPFGDGEFDGVVCLEVLHLLFRPDLAVAEMKRVLRPGGRLVLTTRNVGYWHQRLELLAGRWNPQGDDRSLEEPWRDSNIRFFTAKALERLLVDAGFSSVEVGGLRGALLAHTPLGRWLSSERPSRLALLAQGWRPSLFGMNLSAVAEV